MMRHVSGTAGNAIQVPIRDYARLLPARDLLLSVEILYSAEITASGRVVPVYLRVSRPGGFGIGLAPRAGAARAAASRSGDAVPA